MLYVSSVGDYEFLDGPSGLRQQLWQALRTLQMRGLNVVVSLHPLLEAGQLQVRMNILDLEGEAELGRCLVAGSVDACARVTARGVSVDEAQRRRQQHASSPKERGRRRRCLGDERPCKDTGTDRDAAAATQHHQWAGRKVELLEALREHQMLATWRPSVNSGKDRGKKSSVLGFLDEVGGLSLLPMLADVVVAPVSSGSAMSVLRAPATPLVLLRPGTSWSGDDMAATARTNQGLVLWVLLLTFPFPTRVSHCAQHAAGARAKRW